MTSVEQFWLDEDILKIHQQIKTKNLKVVIPEGEDQRVIDALAYIRDVGIVLLGNKENIIEKINSTYLEAKDIINSVEIVDQNDFNDEKLVELFLQRRKGKITNEKAQELIAHSNYYGMLLLEAGKVDALVGGSQYNTADILKPAFQIIKTDVDSSIVSSAFILKKGDEKLVFADCAVNVEPTKKELKEITRQTIVTAKEMGIEPKVAMLNYSTKGSGRGAYVDLVREAYQELIQETPALIDIIDGELQFDAAYVNEVGALKAPTSKVAGKANVFIFPHLNSGNIGYKIAQYLGGYEAVGPLLQGLNKPVNDLSRGTNAKTIAKVIYLSLRKYK